MDDADAGIIVNTRPKRLTSSGLRYAHYALHADKKGKAGLLIMINASAMCLLSWAIWMANNVTVRHYCIRYWIGWSRWFEITEQVQSVFSWTIRTL